MFQSFKQFSTTLNRPKPSRKAELNLRLKSMSDSFIQQFIFLKSDPFTRELYSGQYNQVRIGKLLENLDALAAAVSYRHLDDGVIMKSQDMVISIVTASVDRIDLQTMPSFKYDMKIYGNVTYVGHSSMEITLKIVHVVYDKNYKLPDLSIFDETSIPIYTAASPESSDILTRVYIDSGNKSVEDLNNNIVKEIKVMEAKFCMVARCGFSGISVQVHPLKLENEIEHSTYNKGAKLRQVKKVQNQLSLVKQPPTSDELEHIHNLFITQLNGDTLHGLPQPLNGMFMSETGLETTLQMQSQDRNVHNFIFGGYLLKTAYELALCTSLLYTKSQMVDFMAMDDVWFRRPVPVGSIVQFQSKVIYSVLPKDKSSIPNPWKDTFIVQVIANVMIKNKFDTSNVFLFTFKPSDIVDLKYIIPNTYQESMLYLTGKRTFDQGIRNQF
eukprot:NODE_36_length_36011_cov_1.012920.p7 type:complete len:441 gc:universal NODE_36_length_36011_cov_1.012920:4549-5871(+)